MSKKAVVRSSFKMVAATLISRIFGLIREQVMAYSFGAGSMTDAFLVAYRIPNLLRDLFAEGAFSSAFVPSFIKVNKRSSQEGNKLFRSVLFILLLITFSLSVLIFIFAPELIGFFAPSFVGEKKEVTIWLTRIMSPFLMLVSIAALFMGVLNSLKIFFIPSVAPAFFNITMIASMLGMPWILSEYQLPAIYSLGIGALLGGLVQGFVQIPLIIKNKYQLTPCLDIHPETKKVFKKLGPGLIGFAATQLNLIVTTILATGAGVGAVSWLSYAFRLYQLPVGILGVSIGNSNLVHFSEVWSKNKQQEAFNLLKESFNLSSFVMLPAMLVTFLCAPLIVTIIFEHGAFGAESSFETSRLLQIYCLSLPFYGIYKILTPVFYAVDRPMVPVITSAISILGNIIFCTYFTAEYGVMVLALGTSLSIALNTLLQFLILKLSFRIPLGQLIDLRFVKVLISAGISLWAGWVFTSRQVPSGILEQLFALAVKGLLICLCYLGLLLLMGEGELVKSKLRRFLKRI